jgi:hypothetical protein
MATLDGEVDEPPDNTLNCPHTRDLRYFLGSTEHLADVEQVRREVVDEIDAVMDDELVSSLEALLEDAALCAEPRPERLELYSTSHCFLKRLRRLQLARLRAAILKLTSVRNN